MGINFHPCLIIITQGYILHGNIHVVAAALYSVHLFVQSSINKARPFLPVSPLTPNLDLLEPPHYL